MALEKDQQASKIWLAALGKLELRIPRPSFETWLKDTTATNIAQTRLFVSVPNAFTVEYLETRLMGLIRQAVKEVAGEDFTVTFQANGSKQITALGEPSTTPSLPSRQRQNLPVAENFKGTTFNPRYTFNSFVVGDSNELAFSALRAIEDHPGKTFNPLVIHSKAGLGKTHLLHALGSQLRAKNVKCTYTTCEDFTNQYINAIQQRKTQEFRDHYRSSEALLIDDIQFLIGKDQTQEGFFHTFNSLHLSNRQIVITSDRPIAELELLQKRISTRLSGGLVADIQPPRLETRLAILQAKSAQFNCTISPRILEFLAQKIQTNVRALEGALNKVVAWTQFRGDPLTIDAVQEIIPDSMTEPSRKKLTASAILQAVSKHYDISPDSIKGRSRQKNISLSRQVTMYFLRQETDLSLTTIGKILGDRDHTTVSHGCQRVATLVRQDRNLDDNIRAIRGELQRWD